MISARATSGDQVHADSSVVEVHVRELSQLFDSLDPSPFHEKVLDRDAEEYIVSRLKELPKAPAALIVYLDKPAGLPNEGDVLGEAIREHFARRSQMLRWELRRLLRRGWISLAIGLSCVAASLIGGEAVVRIMGPSPLAHVLQQSMLIGGWVAMWTPLEIFLYDWWPLIGERRVYDRLSRMAVKVVYTGGPSTVRPESRVAAEAAGDDIRGGNANRSTDRQSAVHLVKQRTGEELGRISESELTVLQEELEEETFAGDYSRIDPELIDTLAQRPDATPQLVDLLRVVMRDNPAEVDLMFQRRGQPAKPLCRVGNGNKGKDDHDMA